MLALVIVMGLQIKTRALPPHSTENGHDPRDGQLHVVEKREHVCALPVRVKTSAALRGRQEFPPPPPPRLKEELA